MWGRSFTLFAALAAIFMLGACGEDPPPKHELRFGKVTDAETRAYCGTCHMAYQPSLLPARSWEKVMAELSDHFDDKVELKPAQFDRVRDYLVRHAGDQPGVEIGAVTMRGMLDRSTPIRITETPYFHEAHKFMKVKAMSEWVISKARCVICHVDAWSGDYTD